MIATLGMIFPSIVIITIIASVLSNFSDYPIVQSAFSGIRIAVSALIFSVVIKMYRSTVIDTLCLIIFLVSLVISLVTNISPIYFVILSAIVGILSRSQKGHHTS